MSNGFIKLHRKLTRWEWYTDIPVKTLFLHLLLKANYEDDVWRGVTVKRGQYLSGRKKLATQTGLSERQIRTALDKLQMSSELTIKATKQYSIYTLENYDKYQSRDIIATNKTTNNTSDKRHLKCPQEKNIRSKEVKNIPPSIDEVSAYCNERNNNIDPQSFIDHYEANGWMRGKNKIKDWKACVRTWEKNRSNQPTGFNTGEMFI